MKKVYHFSLFVLLFLSSSFSLIAQNSFFASMDESAVSLTNSKRVIIPVKYNTMKADIVQLKTFLWSLPSEKNVGNRDAAPILELPMPDGSMAKFHVWESSIMDPKLEAKFPEMKTFSGQGITDPYATIRFDYNPYFGFSAQVLSAKTGRIFIDPYARGNKNDYISYYSRNFRSPGNFICDTKDNPNPASIASIVAAGPCRGTQLYTYRLALACTGEYAVAVCSPSAATVAATAAAMLTAVNRVTGVYETEASIRMQLVPNNSNLIYLNGATDPYTNNNGGTMLSENIANCNAVIGAGNYDIGHVFSTGGGGVAFLGCICTANKAGGVTGLPNPVGDAFYIDYVAHEMGHQYGGNHTFNSITSNCGGGNRNAGTAYEVGSATTIQGYAGICGADDIQPHSDPFFHTVSFDEISNYAAGTGGTCAAITATGNTLPVITAMNNNGANIPIGTPFTLTGTATDANNDPLTYCWEEWDLGTGGAWNNGINSTTSPLFKSRLPKTSGSRTFPDIAVILAGYPAAPAATMDGLKGESLPQVARAIKFRLTVRDNRAGGGGVVTGGDGCQAGFTGIFQVNTIATSGPFAVTVPNGGESYAGGSTQTVTWNVVGTDVAPINCANVKISLSTDGGLTYPTVILASTPNDGTQAVTIPSSPSTTARIKVEAVGNVFFDISNANFIITGTAAPTCTINQAAAQADPTSTSPINFTVVFDQSVINFTTGDVTLTGTAGATTGTVTGGPSTYNVAVSGMTATGTVIATVAAGVCTNAALDPNAASTSTDNTVTFNLVANNDNCSGALPIACGQTITGTTVGFTADAVATCVTTLNTAPGVWYTFAGDGSVVTLSLCGSGYDTKIGVFSGNCAALTCVTGNDDFCGLQSQVSFSSVVGTTYYVLVTGFGTGSGAFTLARSCITPPPNDGCTGAITISCNQTITGTTVGATSDAVATCITTLNTAPGLWYTFIGNGVSNTISLCGSGFDTKIGIFSGTCAALVCVTGNDDFCGLQSQVTFTPVLGTTYYVLVTGFNTAAGAFTLARTCAGIANDVCFEALPIACGQTISATTVGSTSDAVAACVTTLNTAGGVWYKFTGNGSATTLSLCGSGYDTKIGVFSGTCAALVCVTGNDDFCGLQSQVTFTTVLGTDYYVLVTGFSTNTGAFTLARTCALPPCLPSTITPAAPAPICAGIIQQLTASSANAGNPPHVWAPVTELFTDAAASVAYTGTAVNIVYAKPSVTRTYTATLQSSTCAATPASVTITVNPNPTIVIVADPGTTICEGDPTLLTVVTGSATSSGILYTQGPATPLDGSPSQVFEPANTAFNSQSADDFTVPAGNTWTITQITANGIGTGNPTSVNVFIYNNAGTNLPGTAVASMNNITTFVRTGGNYSVTLPSSVILTGGTYWVSLQVNMPFAGQGQWFWGNYGTTNVGNQYAWQNPGGGFGTPCTNWGYGATGCAVGGGVNRNNIFSLTGTSLASSGPLPAGYTFLWSPALGLSSTTSNPVAASPMNTTTYTVTATTPGGCTRTASVLITVNKRPTVTTQPVAIARCAGTSASFTVGATGTGLTYQWQVNTAGCTGGTWVILTNNSTYSGVNNVTLIINPVTGLMNGYGYRCIVSGVCAPIGTANISNCAVLTVNPLPVVAITPPISCGGVAGINGTQLSTASTPPPVPGSVTVNSGTINLAIPDNTAAGVSNIINVAGVPANATITNISVALNMPHTYPADMTLNLKGPNGQIMNLYKHNTNTDNGPASVPTAGFFNAVANATSSVAFLSVPSPFRYGQTAPAGPYKADGLNGALTNPGYTIFDPTGFVSNAANFAALYSTPNGAYTLAMCDGGPGDVGTLTSWSVTVDYTTPGTTSSTLSYVWSPLAGLYNDAGASSAYTGTNTPVVYAAPTVFTAYTVTATNTVTGCVNTATAFVNYTPPAPTVTPSSVAMCLGDPAVRLVSSSSTPFVASATSGTINLAVPDNTANGVSSNLNIAGIPANGNITNISVTLNMSHTYPGDMIFHLKAPNGQIFNLYKYGTGLFTGPASGVSTWGWYGAKVSQNGTTAWSSVAAAPFIYNNSTPWKADGINTPVAGAVIQNPTGFVSTAANWNALYSTGPSANGTWTLAMCDGGPGDVGTLASWSLDVNYAVGVPSTPATWSPLAGLYNDAAAGINYAGDARDTVYAKPTTLGANPYLVTVKSLPVPPLAFANTAPITISTGAAGPANPSPAILNVSGLPTTGVTVKNVTINGLSHTWAGDVNIVLQHPNGTTNVILMANSNADPQINISNVNLTFSDAATASIPTAAIPSGTYLPTNRNGATFAFLAPGPTVTGPTFPASPTLSTFTGDMNGTWKLFVEDRVDFDGGGISGGFSVGFDLGIAACTSPARTVIVTVNTPTTVTAQPANQTICTDKVATFTVAAGGTGPFSYQWQVSTNGNNPPWTNITNGGVYSGATTATLTITAPPVSMSGYFYRAVITGAAPCAAATSFAARLIVNPLPIVVIAPVYSALLPGLTTTLTSTVSPFAAASPGGYTWIRDGVVLASSSAGVLSGIGTGTLKVDVDGMGLYTLRVTDVNGCTNTSNSAIVKDSASGKCFIYPNPSSGTFQVRYYSVANNVLPRGIVVYDAKGDRVFLKNYTVGRPYDRMDVDMRAYGKGLYWVEIVDLNGNRLTMCRVVIQ